MSVSTMAVLEIAESIQRMKVKPKRSTLLVWHTGEEAGLVGSAFYVAPKIGTTLAAYFSQVNASIDVDDLTHGLTKSLIFAVLITIVSVIDGISVKGGAEGVGRVTTSAVVHGISAIVLTDMIFVFMTTS